MSTTTPNSMKTQAETAAIEYLVKHYEPQEPEDDVYLYDFAEIDNGDGIPSFWIGFRLTAAHGLVTGALNGVRVRNTPERFHLVEYIKP